MRLPVSSSAGSSNVPVDDAVQMRTATQTVETAFALVGPGAVVAGGDGVGELVALADEGGQVLQVPGRGASAEDDLGDGRIPDGSGGVVAPLVAGLGQRLQHGHGGDAGAAALGHQHG